MNLEHLKGRHDTVKIGQNTSRQGYEDRYDFDLFQRVLGPDRVQDQLPVSFDPRTAGSFSFSVSHEGSHSTAIKRPSDDSFVMSPILDMLSHLVDIF